MKKILIISGIIVIVLYGYLTINLFFNEEINTEYLKDLTNYKIDDIKKEYNDYQISIIYIDSNEEKDTILYTNPSANKLISEGQKIELFVSSGITSNTYKNLTNKYYEDNLIYIEWLIQNEVEVIIENQISNDYPDGTIIKQSSYGEIKANEKFIITVNYNEALIEIPNLINKTEDYVINYFKETKIEIIFIYNSVNNTKNLVYYQSIKPNSLVLNTNTKLYIYIAL